MNRLPRTRSCCDRHTRRQTGCRACADRAARWQRQYEYETERGLPRTVPSAPYRRMVEQLLAAGWRGKDIAELAGWTAGSIHPGEFHPRIKVEFADRITRVYDELRDFPGPSRQTALRAARAGYTPPPPRGVAEASDQVAVDRALTGEAVPLSPDDFCTAVFLGIDRGMTPSAVAVTLHTNLRRVRRVLDGGPGLLQRGRKKQAA